MALRGEASQCLQLGVGGGLAARKAVRGDKRQLLAQAPKKNSKMAVFKEAFGSAVYHTKSNVRLKQNKGFISPP